MADWRGKGSDRPAPKKPTPLPVVPRPAPNPVAHEAKPSGGAKGSWKKKSPRVERASHSTPAWRRTPAASEGTGALKRVTRLASVGVLATASFLLFAWYVFSRTYVIPVFVSVSTSPSERISALGEFSYPQATENRINANQETIRRFRLTRESNESDLLIRAIAGSENWTADLSKKGDRDLTSKFLGDSNRLIGGGQGRRLVVFYFQGTIARNQNSSWELLFSDANPFSLKGPQNGVALGQLFDRVGTALARDAFALIILDVSPPSVVTNLGDLEFPAADIQAEFDKLQANRERMAIFLPCNQSEENLVAPELASSVFGHFALEGLETGFGDRTMTLDAYVQQVRKRVSSWSGQYRLAKQEPILITAESTERLLKDLHFYGLFSRLPKATSAAASTNYLERASELDRFWEQWTMLRGYYAIDPILYKSIEAQLVVLENVAESSGDSWGSRINKLERDLESVRKRWRVDRRVSLIESVFDQRIGRSNLFSSDVILPSQARPTATGSTYSRDDLGWILWSKWSTAAKSKDTTEWKKTFDWEVMAKELNTLGKPINNLEWLELQVCRILHEETIDQTDDSVRAMASLIAAFSTLQETVCTSGTPPQRILKDKTFLGSNTPWERIPWIHSEVLAAESEFLQAFDAYCVGNFTDAFQRCDNLLHKDGKLTKLKEKADTIDQAIEMRDRVLAESPHLLAFLLRECPYTEIAQSLIEQVAISVDRAKRLELLLDRSKNQDWMALSSVPDWDSLLEDAFDLRHLREGAASDPESIRVYRAAIRCPLTPPAVRQSLRERYADYLRSSRGKTDLSSAPEKSIDVPTKGSQAELKLAYSNQLEELNTPDRELLKMQLSTGLRHLAPEEADQQKDTNLYAQSRRIRFFASDLAVNPSLVLTDRPWNSPTAFMASCERDYRELQIRRFYSSRWGAGDLTVGPEKLYFRQCAQSYFSAAEDLRGFHESQVAPQLESELWENAKRDFGSFTFQSDLTDNQRELRIFSESAPTHWDKAIGSARLQPTSTSRPSSLVAAVALNTSGPLNALLPIPAGINQLPNSFRFAIRGHSLHTPLAPPLESTRWSTSFQADKELASIRWDPLESTCRHASLSIL